MVKAHRLAEPVPQRIAIVRALPGLGDLLCAFPAWRCLRRALPQAQVKLIGLPWARTFVKRYAAYLDNFIEFPAYPGIPEAPPQLTKLPAFFASVQEQHFDHTGATAPSWRYPPEGFASVARRLVLDMGIQVIFTGTEPKRELVEGIQTAIGVPSHSLVGCLNLSKLVAFVAIAPVLIANNTGSVHIAAAVGTPVVDLYALTNPQHTPWAVPHRVLFHDVPCKYCYKSIFPEGHNHCLRLVTPESIVRAACELLTETRRLWPHPCGRLPPRTTYHGC